MRLWRKDLLGRRGVRELYGKLQVHDLSRPNNGGTLSDCLWSFGAPASFSPEERSARREFELLLLLGGSRKGAVQLWKWERRQRIYANAQQAAGRPATEAKGSRGAAERQAGGESKPETAAQAARRHRSEHRLREKHLARKIWAAVRVRKHLSRWCERARAAVAKRPASSSTTSTAAAAPPPAWLEPGFFSRATADFIFIFVLFLKLKLRFFARFFLPPATIFQNFAKAVSLRGG